MLGWILLVGSAPTQQLIHVVRVNPHREPCRGSTASTGGPTAIKTHLQQEAHISHIMYVPGAHHIGKQGDYARELHRTPTT